jgi:hypothetical protein
MFSFPRYDINDYVFFALQNSNNDYICRINFSYMAQGELDRTYSPYIATLQVKNKTKTQRKRK